MRTLIFLMYLILVIIGVSFASLNAGSVQVHFYFTSLSMPISVLMVCMLGAGIVIGFLLSLLRYWRLKGENRKIKNQLRLTEKEIKNLRAIPLQD